MRLSLLFPFFLSFSLSYFFFLFSLYIIYIFVVYTSFFLSFFLRNARHLLFLSQADKCSSFFLYLFCQTVPSFFSRISSFSARRLPFSLVFLSVFVETHFSIDFDSSFLRIFQFEIPPSSPSLSYASHDASSILLAFHEESSGITLYISSDFPSSFTSLPIFMD